MNDPEKKIALEEHVPAPDGVKRVYSNHYKLTQTLMDVRVSFGEMISIPDSPEMPTMIEERAVVTLSLLNTKFLAQHLTSFIRAWEEKNGPIEPPKLVSDEDMNYLSAFPFLFTTLVN